MTVHRSSSVFPDVVTDDLTSPPATDLDINMADNAGSYKVKFKDSDGTVVVSIDSDGNIIQSS